MIHYYTDGSVFSLLNCCLLLQLGGFYPSSFGPRIDVERETPVLSDHPAKLIAEKKFNDVPLISGLTKDEGAFMAAGKQTLIFSQMSSLCSFISVLAPVLASGNGEKLAAFNKDPITSVRYILGLENRIDGLEIATQVYSHYFGNQETGDRITQFGQVCRYDSDLSIQFVNYFFLHRS